jgi:hypothetical protein
MTVSLSSTWGTMSTEHVLSVAKLVPALLLAPLAGCSGGAAFTTTDASAPGDDDSGNSVVIVNPGHGGAADATAPAEAGSGDAGPGSSAPTDGAPTADAGTTCAASELSCDGGCVPNDSTHCGACGSPCTSPDGGVASCNSKDGGPYQCVIACGANETNCGTSCVDTQSDPNNCGRCGHSCVAGECTAGACESWVVANTTASEDGLIGPRAGSGSGGHFAFAADAKNVVWIDPYQGVLEASTTGGASAPVMNLAQLTYSTSVSPAYVAVGSGVVAWATWDVNNGIFVYKATEGTANSGTQVASLGTGTAGDLPFGMALDPTGSKAYFIDSTNAFNSGGVPKDPELYQCDLVGRSCSPVFRVNTPNLELADDVAFVGSRLIWTDSLDGNVWLEDYSKNSMSAIATTQKGPCLLAVDSDYVYWADVTLASTDAGTAASFTVIRTSQTMPGVNTVVVPSTPGELSGMATDGVYLYFSGVNTQNQWFFDYVPVDGSVAPKSIKAGQEAAAIAAAGGAIYWLNYSDNTIDGIAAP